MRQLVLFFKRILLLVVFYQFIRLGFLIYNYSFLDQLDYKTFLGGLIFDLSAIGYINLIFALLHFIPGQIQENKIFQTILFYSFYIVNAIFITTNFIDYEYYKFIGRRSSFSMMMADGMEQEIPGLIQSYMVDYYQIPLLIIFCVLLFYYILSKIEYKNVGKLSFKLGIPFMLLAIGIMFIMGRGVGRKPLRIVDASNYGVVGNSAFILNTPFTILKTLNKKEVLNTEKYFSDAEAEKYFNPIQHFSYEKPNNKNVVVLILESFGNENINRGQTPFLDSLITKSYYFDHAFANGKLSIDAVPSTISSIPSLMNKSYISSSYALNQVNALPKVLKKHGYNTSFFHGAFNGSQNFNQYSDFIGFDKYYGKNEYKGPYSFDGKWGVFDEDFLQFFNQELSTFKEPFFTTLFTISSHPPFTIPEKYQNKFPKGTTEIHESIAYSDFALKKFFESARQSKWYNNTIFIITADHTSSSGEEKIYKNNIGKFRIPILFHVPGDENFVGVNHKNMQQIDIYPSIMDLLQINDTILCFGKSYLSDKDYVVNYIDNIYNLEIGDYYLAFDGNKSLGLYNWKTDPLLEKNLIAKEIVLKNKMEKFIKAYIQSFNQRVVKNQLVVSRELEKK